jgi:hypothetical protein
VDLERLAVTGDVARDLEVTRAAAAEGAARVTLSHVDADGDFAVRTADAGHPAATLRSLSRSELPLALTSDEAAEIAERWVAEARVARDRVRFALPPSAQGVGAGDVVTVPGAGSFRLDAVEEAGLRQIEAVRVEPGIYRPAEYPASPVRLAAVVPPLPVEAAFLDLPLLTGAEDPAAPHVAMTADPWARAALYASSQSSGFALEAVIEQASVMGQTETALASAVPGAWDRGAPLRVRLYGGALASASEGAVLNGANAMAIGDGAGDWEVFQFARADLVAPGLWELSRRLRGQAGTDGVMPPVWPAGSRVVLLDGRPVQFALPPGMLGLDRVYRYGPARRPPGDASYREVVRGFWGAGLRPYAPVHLRARVAGGDTEITWIRRTRIDGDRWEATEVPLGEAFERYLVRVVSGGVVRRTAEVGLPRWSYGAADRAADGVTGPYEVQVAQISDRVGPGLFGRIWIDG